MSLIYPFQKWYNTKIMQKKEKRKRRKRYIFGRFARWVLSLIFPKQYRVHYTYDINIDGVEPPYFMFGNHTSFLDPFLMGIGARHHVNFVANDEYFRFRSLSILMRLLGAIPKTKFITDYDTVKLIFKLYDNKDVIGIYPEGGRTWPGLTQPLLFSTSKLVKKLNAPVVCALTKGGSLSFPRWAKKYRKGKIFIHYKLVLTPEQIEKMTAQEIHEVLTKELAHDEIAWNKAAKIAFKGKKLAERLELFIYSCPKCNGFETMTSKDNEYTCRECGYKVKYNPYGLFERENDAPIYDNVTDWNIAQYKLMKEKLSRLNEGETLLQQDAVKLFNGKRKERVLGILLQGALSLNNEGFVIKSDNETRTYHYDKISGLTVNHSNILDFYYDGEKLRFEFKNKQICGYIWEDAIKALKEINAPAAE